MRCVAKTHKDPGPDGTPKSRPIVGASKGLTTSLGELLSDILDPVAKTVEDPREAQSTEELMRSIQETNVTLEQQKVEDCLVASMDVEALYPSIDQVAASKIVKEEYIRSDVEVKDVDWRMVALYLAVTVPEEELVREGIFHLVARKRKNKGRKTTVRNPKISGPLKRSERKPEEGENQSTDQEEEEVLRIGERLDQEIEDSEPDNN